MTDADESGGSTGDHSQTASVSDEAVDALVAAASTTEGPTGDRIEANQTDAGFSLVVAGDRATALSEAEFRERARSHPAAVAEWFFWYRRAPETPARRAFLRWLEPDGDRSAAALRRALRTGHTSEWGQLRITVSLRSDGERTYDLRHCADASATVADLVVYDDPEAATDLVRLDDAGDYRPLKTAPTLSDGWVFPDLDPGSLVRTVSTIYPATVENWYREREGGLDVTHWREAAARQTGRYAVVDELSGAQVDRLADACCADSQCLKRRVWDESANEPLEPAGGDGVFPCREPCSLVVAAAREIALAERGESTPTTLDLTSAEREQLGRIVEAVADGSADGVRDGDLGDGANRLRARYLAAKLFGDGATVADEHAEDT